MIPAAAEHGVGFTSPVSRNPKHQTTPLRPKRKTSRKDQGIDVHTICTTPNRLTSEIQNNDYSPSDTFPYSQENCPEVVWDYTSPKLPKGAKKRELKITVEEFLKNLTHNKAPECNTQTSHYIKLLEKWMTKQNTPISVKKPPKNNVKRDSRMRSRKIYEDIKKLMTSVQARKEEITEENNKKENVGQNNRPKSSSPNPTTSVNKRSFLDGDKDDDSLEELWGESDNSFIIKATQHLDVTSPKCIPSNKNFDVVSTIPETAASLSHEPVHTNFENEQSGEKNSLNKAMLDSDYHAQILLTQIINHDWESDSENEDLENGFIMGDEALSLIPDEMLCGVDSQIDVKENVDNQSVAGKSNNREILSDKKSARSCIEDKRPVTEKWSCELSFGSSENDQVVLQTVNQSEIELFNNFEDESFGDESILCKPEVLSWIDEVESKLSQSQKCTPEEIEKKKDEAIQRRKKNLSRP